MYLRWLKKGWLEPKLELLTILVPRYGRIVLMTQNVIFGHLDVLYMKWQA